LAKAKPDEAVKPEDYWRKSKANFNFKASRPKLKKAKAKHNLRNKTTKRQQPKIKFRNLEPPLRVAFLFWNHPYMEIGL
jgi:hypothetical protein